MEKVFNTTGTCIPTIHYMVNINNKLDKIEKMIDKGNYFVINRPRQYGKTTTLSQLDKRIKNKYTIIRISFEGMGNTTFESEQSFCEDIIRLFVKSLKIKNKELSNEIFEMGKKVKTLTDLDEAITRIINNSQKEIVLFVDEVDKSSSNQLFLNFLGMLRNKYLLAIEELDYTFKSVILCGVHDIKNMKLKFRDNEEAKQNSPWNIAVNFNLDMSFNKYEIKSMLDEYSIENNLEMDTEILAKNLYYYTDGYPFLVSRVCQIIDEEILDNKKQSWNIYNIERAIKYILTERNTLFDDLIKNLENNKELYDIVNRIVLEGNKITFNRANPIIDLGITYGVFKEEDGSIKVNNRIYEQYIYDYLSSKTEVKSNEMSIYNYKDNFIEEEKLNFTKILLKFSQFMKEQYSTIDYKFIEREGRLLFLAFIKPIINGVGFDFKEVQISEEKRLDVVINYNKEKYIVELKIWRGEKYHEKGILQLVDYLDIHGLDKGYMVIYNFNKNKEYKNETINIQGKNIFIVYV